MEDGGTALAEPPADLGAWVCFEDECGRTMRSPVARTWARRGRTPVVRAPSCREGRASVVTLACYRPGQRSRLVYWIHLYQRRKGEAASFTWRDYRDLIIMAHVQLGAPIVLVWDNLNRHISSEIRRFIPDSGDWLRVFQLPSYAPALNPVEDIWALLNRGGLANLTAASLDHLVRVIKRS